MKLRSLSHLFSVLLLVSFVTANLPQSGYAQVGTSQAAAASAKYAEALAAIETKVEARRAELGIPGMSLAIVKDGEVIYSKGLGFKDFERKIPATADTQFAIGSATKAFTALTVLMTADEGKLSLDDSPKTILPYFKMADPDTDKNMTIRDLLTHSSGLNRTDLAMITGKLTRAELIRVAGEAKPIGKLREKFGYQNLMYTAAGEVVAVAQKKEWEKFVPERIFTPLGMANSNMSVAEMEKAKDRSLGYVYNFDTKETKNLPYREISQVAPAGSINSSANDMAKWLRFILNGGELDGKRLVSEKSFDEWLKPQMKIDPAGNANYALGWFVQKWNGHKVVQHGGNIDGFNALVAMIPEKKLGFVMLTNVSGSPLGSELMPLVWSNILGGSEAKKDTPQTPEAPGAPAATSGNPDAAKELIGKYRAASGALEMEIKENEGKVQLIVPGQQPYTLNERSKDNYHPAPLPEGFALKVKRDDAGKLAGVVMVQPQGELELKPISTSERPAITADELMAKVIDATGGEANWKGLHSRIIRSTVNLEQQGVRGEATSWAKAPNKTATETKMFALGKQIATGWEYFDGTTGEEGFTFSPVTKYTGKRLEDVKLSADLSGILNWKSKYKKVEVTRTAKVGDEDAYVVEFEPYNGSKYTDYFSTKSFLLLKRDGTIPSSTSTTATPYSVRFEDYRVVDGVKMPFRTINTSAGQGDIVTMVTSIKHNEKIDDKLFAPRKLK